MKRRAQWLALVLSMAVITSSGTVSVFAAETNGAAAGTQTESVAADGETAAGSEEDSTVIQKNINISTGSDKSELNFAWYCSTQDTGKIRYAKSAEVRNGELPANAKETAGTTGQASNKEGYYYFHQKVTGLEAGTEYSYQLVNGTTVSEIHTFKTAADGEFSFIFVGDPQIGASGNRDNDAKAWSDALGKFTKADSNAAFLLSAGDQTNIYQTNKDGSANSVKDCESEYDGYLDNAYMPNLVNPSVIGNHDDQWSSYQQHVYTPNQSDQYGKTLAGADGWFVYNNVLFLELNDNNMSSAEHKAFMEEAIAANPDVDWKVVVMHHSVYSVANHAYDEDILQRREELTPIFDDLGIDVVLQGHDHVYVRSYIMKGNQALTDPSAYDSAEMDSITNPDGILYITANSGSGSKYYNIKDEQFTYAAVKNQEKTPNYSNVTISADKFTITTYRTNDNSVVDTFTITHSDPFTDVNNSSEYYYSAASWAKKNSIALGYGNGMFGPSDKVTRGQMIAFVYRYYQNLAKSGGSKYNTDKKYTENPFSDVKSGKYYTDAVLWAYSNNITEGTSKSAFSPDATVTRAQMVTFLYRAAKTFGNAAFQTGKTFTDVQSGEWYTDAVSWAIQNNVTFGYGDGSFGTEDACLRADGVTFLYRADKADVMTKA